MTYKIQDHLSVLTPSKGSKTKYHCPVCNGHNLDIQLHTGAYACFSGECEAKEIRAAIDLLEGKEAWKPGQTEKPYTPTASPAWVKPIRHQQTTIYDYPARDGKPLVKVKRIDKGDGSKKGFVQEHYDESQSKWINGNPDGIKQQIPIYRYKETQIAIANSESIWVPEGELTVEKLRELGLAATTTIGGSGGFSSYGEYQNDLAQAAMVLAPDREKGGVKYIQNFIDLFPNQVRGVYLAGNKNDWINFADDGRDIADDISEFGFNLEQLQARVISLNDYLEIINVSSKPEKTQKTTPKTEHPKFDTDIKQGLFKNNVKIDPETGDFKLVREYIGNHLEAKAYVNNPENNDASIHIEFKNIRNKLQRWTMPRAAIVHETSLMLAELQKRGYYFDINKKKQLVEYLNALGSDIEKTYTITDSTGWIDGSYVTQNKTYSVNEDSDLKFRDVEDLPDAVSEIKGLLAQWQKYVGEKCAGNSRLIFAIGTGLAASLQFLVDMESGGFHIVGTTSVGKTTMLKVAASVVGIKDIPHWRTTTNGLESTCCAYNHMLLPLDEIGQADPKEVGAIAYMIANGQGKTRMNKNLTNRKPKTWQLLFLSSGELGMGAYMAQSGIALKGGQEVRLPDIPAVPFGSGFGIFETIHGCESAKEFAESLDQITQNYHGTLLDAFLPKLVADQKDQQFANQLKKQVSTIAKKLAEGTTDTAISRVANRFALVQVALELAHSYGLLPFPLDHIDWAISKIFKDWLNHRGGDGSIEIKNACDRIRSLFVSNQHGDRIFDVTENHHLVRNLLAYCKSTKDSATNVVAPIDEFWVPGTVFDKELCGGVDKTALVLELQQRGWLLPPRNDGKAMHTRTCNGKRSYFYIFNPIKMLDCAESEKEGVQGVQGVQEDSKTSPEPDPLSSIPVHLTNNTGVHGVQLMPELDGNEQACTPCTPRENPPCTPNFKSEIKAQIGLNPLGTPSTPRTPKKTHLNKIKIGDRVENRQTGERGTLSTWYSGRTKAIIQLDNADLTDWIPQSDLILLEAS